MTVRDCSRQSISVSLQYGIDHLVRPENGRGIELVRCFGKRSHWETMDEFNEAYV